MPKSVLEAIKMGIWDFEPPEVEFSKFEAADAMPGTSEKLTFWPSGPSEGFPCGMRMIATTWNRRPREIATETAVTASIESRNRCRDRAVQCAVLRPDSSWQSATDPIFATLPNSHRPALTKPGKPVTL